MPNKPVATKPVTPMWLKRMPEKWRKVKGEWIGWQHPVPTKDPAITNKQRFHANPKRQAMVTDLLESKPLPSTDAANAPNPAPTTEDKV